MQATPLIFFISSVLAYECDPLEDPYDCPWLQWNADVCEYDGNCKTCDDENLKSKITEYFTADVYPDGCLGKANGHIPFVSMSDTYGILNVNLTHGATKEHYILGIYLRDQSDAIVQMQNFTRPAYAIPAPLTYSVELDPKWTTITPYAFCNIHGVWKGITYEIPAKPAEDPLASEIIAGCIFAAIVLLACTFYTLQECGILSVLSDTIAANEFFLSVVALSWKIIDFCMTVLGLWELFSITSPEWFRLTYCIFVGIHCVCFLYGAYAYAQLFIFFYNNDIIETPILGTVRGKFSRVLKSESGGSSSCVISQRSTAKYQMEKYRILSTISLGGVCSFWFEDLIGSFLALYGIATFDEVQESFIMIMVGVAQVFEMGTSTSAFVSYVNENERFEAAKYKYELFSSKLKEGKKAELDDEK